MSGSKIIGSFIISDTKDNVIISTKSGDWQVRYNPLSKCGTTVKFHLDNNNFDALKLMLTAMYTSCNFCAVDVDFVEMVFQYTKKKNEFKF